MANNNSIRLSTRDDTPCHGCPDRYPACSGHCEKPEYLAWRAELKRVKKNRRQYEINRAIYDFKNPVVYYDDEI